MFSPPPLFPPGAVGDQSQAARLIKTGRTAGCIKPSRSINSPGSSGEEWSEESSCAWAPGPIWAEDASHPVPPAAFDRCPPHRTSWSLRPCPLAPPQWSTGCHCGPLVWVRGQTWRWWWTLRRSCPDVCAWTWTSRCVWAGSGASGQSPLLKVEANGSLSLTAYLAFWRCRHQWAFFAWATCRWRVVPGCRLSLQHPQPF